MSSDDNRDSKASEAVKSILLLSALGITGKYWEQILWHGGATQIILNNPDLMFALLGTKKQIGFTFENQNDLWQKAHDRIANYDKFVGRGNTVLGSVGPHEFGRLNRAPSRLLCAFLRGNRELLRTQPVIAIVGSRTSTVKGCERAYDLACQLSKAGCLIVSGGALGIDLAAHEGALAAEKETLVILADPISFTKDERPARIKQLHPFSLVSTLSIFPPWTYFNRSLFVTRNQYIAAIADAVIIVEGKIDSGTLHTARFARKMNIPVWAIPGDPDNPQAGAANLLLQEGEAKALINRDFLLNSLNIKPLISEQTKQEIRPKETSRKHLALDCSDPIMNQFAQQNGRVTMDFLCDQLQKPVPELLKELLELELIGKIRKEGSEFVLITF